MLPKIQRKRCYRAAKWLKSDLSMGACYLQSTTGGKQRPAFEDASLPALLLEIFPKEKGKHFRADCLSLTQIR